MEYREHTAAPALQPFVECFWTLSSGGRPAPPEAGTILPDGCVEIVLSFADPVQRVAEPAAGSSDLRHMLVGQLDRLERVVYTGTVDLLGVRFQPGAAHVLLGTPMDEIARRIFSLDCVAMDLDRRLGACLDGALSREERIAALERTLTARLASSRLRDPVVERAARMIRGAQGRVPISILAHELGISTRQLERRFERIVGVAPKLLSRIFRFRHVWEEAARETPASWAELAAAAGYSDQAHLIREFHDFAGGSPARIFGDAGGD